MGGLEGDGCEDGDRTGDREKDGAVVAESDSEKDGDGRAHKPRDVTDVTVMPPMVPEAVAAAQPAAPLVGAVPEVMAETYEALPHDEPPPPPQLLPFPPLSEPPLPPPYHPPPPAPPAKVVRAVVQLVPPSAPQSENVLDVADPNVEQPPFVFAVDTSPPTPGLTHDPPPVPAFPGVGLPPPDPPAPALVAVPPTPAELGPTTVPVDPANDEAAVMPPAPPAPAENVKDETIDVPPNASAPLRAPPTPPAAPPDPPPAPPPPPTKEKTTLHPHALMETGHV